MKKITLIIAGFLMPLFAIAQAEKIGDTMKVGDDVYMLVREIKGVKENTIFQQNISIMQTYAKALKNAKEQLESEGLSEETKESLKTKIKEIEDMYLSNNEAMIRTYNFAVERQYRQDHEDMFLSTYLSDSEVDNLQFADGSLLDIERIAEENSRKIYRQNRVQGADNVRKFQRELFSLLNRQIEINKLEEELLNTADPLEKNTISAKISTLNESLEESKKYLDTEYSMKPNRDYFIELNSCKLYLLLTAKEVAQKEQSAKKN